MAIRTRAMAVATAAAMLAGCASSPEKIQTASVSKLQYKDYDCEQIAQELERVNRRAGELYANLKSDADGDTAAMAVGLVLFWPALFFLEGGDGPEAQEYARIKGEKEALESVAIEKKCSSSGAVQAKASSSEEVTPASATGSGSGTTVMTSEAKPTTPVEVRLTELKRMRDENLISEELYQQRKSEILKDL